MVLKIHLELVQYSDTNKQKRLYEHSDIDIDVEKLMKFIKNSAHLGTSVLIVAYKWNQDQIKNNKNSS